MIKTFNLKLNETDFDQPLLNINEIFQSMLELRIIESNAQELYEKGLIRGFCHLNIGEEAIYALLEQVLEKNDKVTGSYRCHGLSLATGTSIFCLFAELLGRKGGCGKGKGGSMHIQNEKFLGGHGIVGAQVPLGCGIALALKTKSNLKLNRNVVFTFYGDGASNQGQIFESFNLAKLLNLPIVFVVVNNWYSMWTPLLQGCPDDEFYRRCAFLPGIRVSTRNIKHVYHAMAYCRTHASTNGPIILQIDTYRLCGHSTVPEKCVYRKKEEVAKEQKFDNLNQVEELAIDKIGKESVDKIKRMVNLKVNEALKAALGCEEPGIEELQSDVLN